MPKATVAVTQSLLSGVQNRMTINFLLTFICDAGKNIHKTDFQVFVQKNPQIIAQSFCRKKQQQKTINFGGFLPNVIKITNNFTKYVMHQ